MGLVLDLIGLIYQLKFKVAFSLLAISNKTWQRYVKYKRSALLQNSTKIT